MFAGSTRRWTEEPTTHATIHATIHAMGLTHLNDRSWIRGVFCTQHLRGLGSSENTSQIKILGTILKKRSEATICDFLASSTLAVASSRNRIFRRSRIALQQNEKVHADSCVRESEGRDDFQWRLRKTERKKERRGLRILENVIN